MICTKSKLNEEIKHIKNILLDNGYPESIIDCNISKKIAQFSTPKRFGPEKCPVYLRVPCIGKASIGLDKNVKTAVKSCYGSITTRVVFTSKRMLPVARKDVLPTTLKSSVVYEYSCHSSSSSFEGHSLQARHKQDWGRGFILLLPQTAALPGSNAGSDVIKPASSFVIQNRQTSCSMWCPMYRARC